MSCQKVVDIDVMTQMVVSIQLYHEDELMQDLELPNDR